jgi:CRISPR/Cas system CSM-associated protein Csm3 (group 7 of RAMP superfamily)
MSTHTTVQTTSVGSLDPGGKLVNIYRLHGTISCRSPLHIGSGLGTEHVDALVQTDCRSYPILTGSGLRGAVRHLLLDAAAGDSTLQERVVRLLGPEAAEAGKEEATSGKVSFYDAPLAKALNGVVWHPKAAPHWDAAGGTYEVTSVKIDPQLGTAKKRFLYNFEVVPQGTQFCVEVMARNVLDHEVGMLLWALEMFGDKSGVASLGAHAGRGFGRVSWQLSELALLGVRASGTTPRDAAWEAKRREVWCKLLDGEQGQQPIESLRGDSLLNDAAQFQAAWQAQLNQAALSGPSTYHVSVPYQLVVKSGLVIRSGDTAEKATSDRAPAEKFHMAGERNPKHRGRSFQLCQPGVQAANPIEVAGLAWHVVVDEQGTAHPQFQISGSGMRGGLRNFLEQGLLLDGANPNAKQFFDRVFGTTDSRGQIEFENAAPCDGQTLRWQCEDHDRDAGETLPNPAVRVAERGPVDRITQGAKSGGLHHFMAVEKGASFSGRILLRDATAEDMALLRVWAAALSAGLLTIGGVGAAGYGQCSIAFDKKDIRVLRGGALAPVAIEALPSPLRDEIGSLTSEQSSKGASLTEELRKIAATLVAAKSKPAPAKSSARAQRAASDPTHAHYMNPYDFVPFPTVDLPTVHGGNYIAPITRTLAEWEKLDRLVSGKLVVRLTALQPVHVLGRRNGVLFQFHRVAGKPVIPGASLRGMLRAFIEARWNGCVSSYSRNADWYMNDKGFPPETDRNPYMRVYGKTPNGKTRADGRYAGFNTETQWQDYSSPKKLWKTVTAPSIPAVFLPPEPIEGMTGRKIDLATFLFGAVWHTRPRPSGQAESEEKEPALRGRVRVSDSVLDSQLGNHYWIPDLQARDKRTECWKESDAFLGGAKPSRSSMSYFRYGDVAFRRITVETKKGSRTLEIAQFLGSEFRGRKFYFHQNWQECVASYLNPNDGENFWAQGRDQGEVSQRHLECLAPKQSATFEIHFHRLPWRCVALLLAALENPGTNIRHKLGYAKPFGFGSVDLTVQSGEIYSVHPEAGTYRLERSPLDTEAIEILRRIAATADWAWACDETAYRRSERWLRYILTYPNENDLRTHLFTYPGFKAGAASPWVRGFALPNENPGSVINLFSCSRTATLDDAVKYWNSGKHTLDIGLYQRRSTHFGAVCNRAQLDGETLIDFIHCEAKT